MGNRALSKKKQNNFSYGCYRVIRWLVWLFYPKMKVTGTEHLPEEACIIVGNHGQMNGPICAELYIPKKRAIWCAYQMMKWREVPAYAYQDFWSGKPKYIRWFYKLLSYVITPFSVCVFNNAHTIPVYHDQRLLATFRQSMDALSEGTSVVIFPECGEGYNHIVNRFQEKFIDTARLYCKRSGKAVCFVPMYIAPAQRRICFGEPIPFDPDAGIESQRKEICQYLMEEITRLAEALPVHKVVPYANIPRSQYPKNIPEETKR